MATHLKYTGLTPALAEREPAPQEDVALLPSADSSGMFPGFDVAGMGAAIQNPGLAVFEHEIVYANDLADGLLRASAERSLVGKRLEEIIVCGRDFDVRAVGERPAQSMVMTLDGNLLEAEIRGFPVPWKGRSAVFLVIWRSEDGRQDIDKLKDRILRLEQSMEQSLVENAKVNRCLQAAKDAADAANRTKSEFLANMSHELRTPLNAIMGFSEIIMNQMFGPVSMPKYVEYARDIHTSSSHLLEIINDILDLSKVEAGKFELVEEKLDIAEIIRSVGNLIKGRLDKKDQALSVNVAPDFPALIADRRAIKQILLNLISNSSKFMERNGTVQVSARRVEEALELSVADRGIGIAPDQLEHVLSPFGQSDSPLARDHQGTGLGLPLVQAMVHLHQGRLFIKSAVGVGTTIRIVFPKERIADASTSEA